MFEELFHQHRLPVTLQSEASECGLACISMVSTFYGHRTNLAELRGQFTFSLKGATLQHIIKVADKINLSARAVRCELEELRELRRPAILHWDLNHFVVLSEVKSDEIIIHDPAVGRRTLKLEEASVHFTGVALELTPTPAFETKQAPDPMKLSELWSRIQGLRGSLAQILLLSVLLQVFVITFPLVNQIVVDEAITKSDLSLLTTVILGFGVLMVIQAAITALRSFVSMYLTNMISFQTRSNLLRHLLRLPVGFFEKRHAGDIITRFNSLQPVQALITSGIIGAILDGLLAVGTLVFMLFYAPTLTLVVVLILSVFIVSRLVTYPYIRRLTEEQIRTSADLQSHFLETLRSVQTVKLFGREEQRQAHWQNLFADNINAGVRLTRFGIWSTSGTAILSGLQTLLVLYLGARAIIAGNLTLGMMFAFQAYHNSFSNSVMGLVNTFISWRLVGLHLERISDIARSEPEANPHSKNTDPNLTGVIELENVWFRYGDNEPWVLQDLNLTINPGEKIAIAGPSGGGKSTLIKLLLALYEPVEGRLLIDKRPISQIGNGALRRHFGVVMQNDKLLSGSLAENITFFDPEPDIEHMIECARVAAIHDEIDQLPMGYQSLIGDMGSALSGGQQQRVLLARALYKKPSILILDEGTANLDELNESLIVQSLGKLPTTQIFVAHRPAAMAGVDRIYHLEGGRLKESR